MIAEITSYCFYEPQINDFAKSVEKWRALKDNICLMREVGTKKEFVREWSLS